MYLLYSVEYSNKNSIEQFIGGDQDSEIIIQPIITSEDIDDHQSSLQDNKKTILQDDQMDILNMFKNMKLSNDIIYGNIEHAIKYIDDSIMQFNNLSSKYKVKDKYKPLILNVLKMLLIENDIFIDIDNI